MQTKLLITLILLIFNLPVVFSCTMYKITENGKTIVGNNEDWISPNSQFWYEPAADHKYGVMYMGLLNNFAQGAINEAGLVFDGFANPELPILNTAGKAKVYIGTAIRNIMQGMRTVEEVKNYLATINLSSLSSSQIVFVDKTGAYLIVEGDELILGKEKEKVFSNFYYSQTATLEEVNLENFQQGMQFLKDEKGKSSFLYCGQVMQQFSKSNVFGTQYTTTYDLNALKVRVYLLHDYSNYIEIDLKEELKKGIHRTMIAELFPKTSIGFQHYAKYNDTKNPALFIKELLEKHKPSVAELAAMDFNGIINTIGYEWLDQLNHPIAAIKVFKYALSVTPNDADLYDSLGEAYLANDDWENAILNYAKSLSLDPENDNAIEKLLNAKNEREKFKEKSFKQVSSLVDRYAQEALNRGNLNSISIAIYRNGNTYHNYYGTLDRESKQQANDSTLFEVASISKVFLGSLVAQAVVAGKIKLSDDIRKYLKDDYPNLAFKGTPITIKDLVTHTLGFETPVGLQNIYKKIAKGHYQNKAIDYNMDSLLEELKSVTLQHKPGTIFDYNNVGSELAAYILEQVNDQPYEVQLQAFFDNLGMKHSYLQGFEQHQKYLAIGYDETNKPAPFDRNPLLGGSAGIITCLPDLMKLVQFQLQSDNPLIKEATSVLFEDVGGEGMGYLWQDLGIAEEEGFYYSKTGDANGIKSGILICPDSDYGQIVIINNQSEAANEDYWGSLFYKIESELIKYPKVNLYALTKPDFVKHRKMALAKFNALKDQKDIYYNTDLIWTLNSVGYDLLGENKVKEAIELFEFAITQAPENANLYDSLGEAFFIDENYKNALINYKKSLKLNPDNDNAKAFIGEINQLLGR